MVAMFSPSSLTVLSYVSFIWKANVKKLSQIEGFSCFRVTLNFSGDNLDQRQSLIRSFMLVTFSKMTRMTFDHMRKFPEYIFKVLSKTSITDNASKHTH